MKTRLMFLVIGMLTVMAALAVPPPEDEVSARWAKVKTVAVYFHPLPDGQIWVSKKLSDVVPVGAITKLIVTEAVTSATPDINTFNVYKALQDDATFYQLDGKYPAINVTFRAIIVTKDSHAFQIEIGRGPDGKGLARLISEKGTYGYFK